MKLLKNNKAFIVVELLIIMLIAVVIAWQYIDKPPMYDEFYHILAANNYIDNGEFSIHEGTYSRASIFTWLVAKSIYYFGDNLVAARMPALVAGILLVCAVFLWARSTFDVISAWLAGILLSISPILVTAMQFCRFYTLHALMFFLLFISCLYLINDNERWGIKSILLILIGIILFYFALVLQVTTIIGIGFILLYAIIILMSRKIETKGVSFYKLFFGIVIPLGIVMLVLFYSELIDILSLFNSYSVWAQENANNKLFYLLNLKADYPILLSIFPVLTLLALYQYPKESLALLLVFIGGIFIHSFAAMKSERYILYLLPMYIVVLAIGLSYLLQSFFKVINDVVQTAFQSINIRANSILNRFVASLCLFIVLIFLIANTEAIKSAPFMLIKNSYAEPYKMYTNTPDWRKSLDSLQAESKQADIIISSASIKAYYYLGKLDYDFNASIHNEVGTDEISIDKRTGFKVMSTKDALKNIVETHKSGLVIFETGHLNNPAYVSKDTVDYVSANMQEVSVEPSSRVRVYKWNSKNN